MTPTQDKRLYDQVLIVLADYRDMDSDFVGVVLKKHLQAERTRQDIARRIVANAKLIFAPAKKAKRHGR